MNEYKQGNPFKFDPTSTHEITSSQIERFLDTFLGKAAGERREGVPLAQVVLVTLPGQNHKYFDPQDRKGITDFIEPSMKSQNVYITMTLQDESINKAFEKPKRRSAEGATCMLGLWVDVDVCGEDKAHKADNLPTREAFLYFLDALGWVPTLIVDSGNGFHIYFLFIDPLYLNSDSERTWAAKLIQDFQLWLRQEMFKEGVKNGCEQGWKLDSTADLARILRVAGTLNHKTAPPKEVVIHTLNPDVRHEPQALREKLDHLLEAQAPLPGKPKTTKSKAKKESSTKASTPLPENEVEATANVFLIVKDCAWLAHCITNAASLSEPDWHQMATLLVRCEGGEKQFHEWSKVYESYVYEEAEQKLRHAKSSPGPVTCAFIERDLGFNGCPDCAYKGNITSPIQLGMTSRLRCIFADCPVDLFIPIPYVVTDDGIFTLESTD